MTKIPSTQELIKLVYSPDVSFDDMLEAAIDIYRTALLTELWEYVDNLKGVYSAHDVEEDIKAYINNLINPTSI